MEHGYNVPYSYGVYQRGDDIVLVTERVFGMTLLERLELAPNEEEAKDLYLMCMDTLLALHTSGLAHGDIRGKT